MSPFYNFILSMWVQMRYTAEKVQSMVPTYITQEECNTILATPQGGLNVAPANAE